MAQPIQLDIEIQRFKDNATEKMNPEVKTRLVEALRSGKYKQTNGYLQFIGSDDNHAKIGFCCLGVLSEIAKTDPETTVDSRIHLAGDSVEYFSAPRSDPHAFNQSTAFMIDEVAEWSGITSEVSGALMGINDNGGSFELIADLIEDHL